MKMIDVRTAHRGRSVVVLSRYTEPEKDQLLLLRQLKLNFPLSRHRKSPPETSNNSHEFLSRVVRLLMRCPKGFQCLASLYPPQLVKPG